MNEKYFRDLPICTTTVVQRYKKVKNALFIVECENVQNLSVYLKITPKVRNVRKLFFAAPLQLKVKGYLSRLNFNCVWVHTYFYRTCITGICIDFRVPLWTGVEEGQMFAVEIGMPAHMLEGVAVIVNSAEFARDRIDQRVRGIANNSPGFSEG